MPPLHTESVKCRSTGKDNAAAANNQKNKWIEKSGKEMYKFLDEKNIEADYKNIQVQNPWQEFEGSNAKTTIKSQHH